MVQLFGLIVGIVALLIGMIAYKYPKGYLTFFGARILIIFKEETRIKITKFLGLGAIAVGLVFLIFGLLF